MGASQRRKGQAGEREAADVLSELTGRMWRRSLVQSRIGGKEAPDIHCDDLPGLHCEVKRGKRISLYAALRQAIDDSGARTPFVLARQDREEWVVLVRLDDLLSLARALAPWSQR